MACNSDKSDLMAQVHIYLQGYDSTKEGMPAHGNERICAEKAYQHAAGRELLAYALAHAYGVTDVSMQVEKGGKPYLSHEPDIHFNISHTKGMLACAVSDRPVGIDVEKIRPLKPAILKKFSDRERDYVLSAKDQAAAYIRLWTMKEACLKLSGIGLSGFDTITCIPGEPLQGKIYRQFLWQQEYIVTAVTGASQP